MTRPPRALRFISAQLEELAPDRRRATVIVQLQPEVDCVGTADARGERSDLASFRCVAEATAEALLQAVGAGDDMLDIDGISVIETLGKSILFVAIAADFGGETRELLGFSVIGSDHAKAGALAVLNATNRFLGVG
jgi:hypothetical protein